LRRAVTESETGKWKLEIGNWKMENGKRETEKGVILSEAENPSRWD
jgi:hypothetical protein